MKKKIIALLLFFVASHVAHPVAVDDAAPTLVDAQPKQSDTYIPLVQDYPSFTVDFLGMDYLYNLDNTVSSPFHNMKKFDWSSLLRGSGAFLYAIRLNQSRFAFCPGIGWSALHYAFAGVVDKGNENKREYPRLKKESELRTECKNLKNKPGRDVLGSAVKIPFIDLLLRLRFNSVLDDPKAGFHTWVGVKFGFRLRAAMLVNYKEYNDSGASLVDNGHFNLRPYALGCQAGIGYGRFGATGGFYFTPLFEKRRGPRNSDSLRAFSFGIYVDLL